MKAELIKSISWIFFVLGLFGLIFCFFLLQPELGGLGIDKPILDKLNNWPVYGKEIVACVNTNCNISNGTPVSLNCQITEIANVALGDYHLAPVINCSGFDGEIHTHDGNCLFSPQDYKAFQDRITHFNHWFAVLKCGHNQYFHMTMDDFKQRKIKIP